MVTFFTPRRIERISEGLVIFCCVVVGCILLTVCVMNPAPVVVLFGFTYFGLAWLVPAINYMQGVMDKKEKKLLVWCVSITINTMLIIYSCVMILYNHATSSYLTFDATCIIAVIFLILTPVFLTSLFFSVSVFFSMDKVLIPMVSHQLEIRPARRPSRQVTAPILTTQRGTANNNTSSPNTYASSSNNNASSSNNNASSSIIPDAINTASIIDMARSQYSSVVDRSTNMLGNMWGGTNNSDSAEMIQPESQNSSSTEPPSYTEVEDTELPSYEDLGAKQVQIGSKVIVVDKDFQVSTFTNV